MTNEIKTYRLIVTLPDTAGEEADGIAETLQAALSEYPEASERDYTIEHERPATVLSREEILTRAIEWREFHNTVRFGSDHDYDKALVEFTADLTGYLRRYVARKLGVDLRDIYPGWTPDTDVRA